VFSLRVVVLVLAVTIVVVWLSFRTLRWSVVAVCICECVGTHLCSGAGGGVYIDVGRATPFHMQYGKGRRCAFQIRQLRRRRELMK